MQGLSSHQLCLAIRTYWELAYPNGCVPANRQHFAELMPTASIDEILCMKGIERLVSADGSHGYALRVGSEWYAHTKIILRSGGPEETLVFSVDTHDALIEPSEESEVDAVRELKERNVALARAVEEKWLEVGIPTQAGILRMYLERVRSGGVGVPDGVGEQR